MKSALILAQMLCAISICWAQSGKAPARIEAEYYVTAYARHYRVPIALARHCLARIELAAVFDLSERRCGSHAVDARHCQAAGGGRPLQS
jgi:hypothetical protein